MGSVSAAPVELQQVERGAPLGRGAEPQQRAPEGDEIGVPHPVAARADRRKAQPFGARDDPGAAGQFGLAQGQNLPDIAVHAARTGEPRGDGAHDVAMAVGEDRAAEELLRPPAHARQVRGRHQKARIAVGVGEGMGRALQVGERARAVLGRRDEMRAVERPPPPDRRRDHREDILMLQVGVAAQPRGVEHALDEHLRDLLVGPPLMPGDRDAQLRLQCGAQRVDHHRVVVEKHRRQAQSERRRGARAARADGARAERRSAAGQDAPPRQARSGHGSPLRRGRPPDDGPA